MNVCVLVDSAGTWRPGEHCRSTRDTDHRAHPRGEPASFSTSYTSPALLDMSDDTSVKITFIITNELRKNLIKMVFRSWLKIRQIIPVRFPPPSPIGCKSGWLRQLNRLINNYSFLNTEIMFQNIYWPLYSIFKQFGVDSSTGHSKMK